MYSGSTSTATKASSVSMLQRWYWGNHAAPNSCSRIRVTSCSASSRGKSNVEVFMNDSSDSPQSGPDGEVRSGGGRRSSVPARQSAGPGTEAVVPQRRQRHGERGHHRVMQHPKPLDRLGVARPVRRAEEAGHRRENDYAEQHERDDGVCGRDEGTPVEAGDGDADRKRDGHPGQDDEAVGKPLMGGCDRLGVMPPHPVAMTAMRAMPITAAQARATWRVAAGQLRQRYMPTAMVNGKLASLAASLIHKAA